ncbi:MAG: cytochrome b5-like heme/steroid binding domain-containing protein [Mobilicoccus sp.]|nr:cytochrome b5-like heme/steroid binding domain-containing protein [Mobilicoccus sp.]
MTRRLAPLAALLLVVGLSACGNDTQTAEEATPAPATEETAAGEPTDAASGTPVEQITMADVQEHADAESCWTVIEGQVYDVTDWISQHPGGAERIEGLCGTDGTDQFLGQHEGAPNPNQRLESFHIGELAG